MYADASDVFFSSIGYVITPIWGVFCIFLGILGLIFSPILIPIALFIVYLEYGRAGSIRENFRSAAVQTGDFLSVCTQIVGVGALYVAMTPVAWVAGLVRGVRTMVSGYIDSRYDNIVSRYDNIVSTLLTGNLENKDFIAVRLHETYVHKRDNRKIVDSEREAALYKVTALPENYAEYLKKSKNAKKPPQQDGEDGRQIGEVSDPAHEQAVQAYIDLFRTNKTLKL